MIPADTVLAPSQIRNIDTKGLGLIEALRKVVKEQNAASDSPISARPKPSLIKSKVEPDKLSFEESREELKTLFQGQVRQPAGNTTATVDKDQLEGESRPPLETKYDEQAV